jgi:ligand-binding sensor domain-containing protein
LTRNLQSLIFILCLLVILGLPAHTTAAEPASRWYRFTSANGLAGNIVQAIWEDPQGRIWFGTEDGASRYDGQQWATFRPADGLLDANVWAISGDAEAVWFATSSGLSRYDGAAWQRFSAADGLPGDDVRAVHVAADGTTWAGTFGQGIAFLRPGAQRWRILPLPATFQRSGVFVQSIWQAGDGTLWFGTNGLGALRLRNNRLEQFSFRAGARNTVWAIGATNGMENGSADTWLATFKGLVRVASDDRIAIAEQIVGGVSLSNTEALAVAGDASGTLWFATRAQGVLRYDSHGWQRIEAADGLGRNYVQSILADRAGRVWFGTRGGGVSVLQRSPLASETLQSEVLLYTAEGEPLQDISSGLLAVQNDLRFVFSTKPSWLPPNELRFRYQLQRLGHGPLAPPVLVEAGPTMPILARSEVLIDLPPGHWWAAPAALLPVWPLPFAVLRRVCPLAAWRWLAMSRLLRRAQPCRSCFLGGNAA